MPKKDESLKINVTTLQNMVHAQTTSTTSFLDNLTDKVYGALIEMCH